jgi:hypothetical protein
VEELAERRLRFTASMTPGSRLKSTARGTHLPPGVVKHVDAAELRIVIAAVLAVTTDAMLAAYHLPRLGALYRTGPPACGKSRAKKRLGGREHAG